MTVDEAIKYFEHSIPQLQAITEQYGLDFTPIVLYEKTALQALREKKERENPKRLTIEELKSMNAPVWVSCFTLEGDPGYWCICQNGSIVCPSGQCFDAADIPHWKFYRHQPKEV